MRRNTESKTPLAEAFQLHRAGNLEAAERLYREMRTRSPGNPELAHLLGFLSYQRGEWKEAEELVQEAVAAFPAHPLYRKTLGDIFRAQGMGDCAKECYARAVQLQPDFTDALQSLGELCMMRGDLQEALTWFGRALEADPRKPEPYFALGKALKEKKEFVASRACHEAGLALKPDFAEGYGSLGDVLAAMGRTDEAVARYEAALRLKPDLPSVMNNLANILKDRGQCVRAIELYRKALSVLPGQAELHYNLATALTTALEFQEALKEFDAATALRPEYAEAHTDKGLLLLLVGDLVRGWEQYEWRFKINDPAQRVDTRTFEVPLWDGSPLRGKTILIHSEQGAGDAIQFCRYLSMVKARGGNVIFECPPGLVSLLSGVAGADQVIERKKTVSVEFQTRVPLLSLPWIFRTTLQTIPAPIPYLRSRTDLAGKARALLAGEGFKVGICWQGNPKYKGDPQRSVHLQEFLALQIPGVRLFSLQKGVGSEQLAGLPSDTRPTDLGALLDTDTGAFEETAAVMEQLDLVISTDTAIPHLAGALGRPVWLLVSFIPEWRWLLGRDDSPWYPTMRVFRQEAPGDWGSVFRRVAGELRQLAGGTNR